MLALLFLLQAAGAQAPDVELDFHARAKSVEIRQKGEAKLEVRGGEASRVESRVQPKAQGRTRLRNVTIEVHAEARGADPTGNRATAETGTPR